MSMHHALPLALLTMALMSCTMLLPEVEPRPEPSPATIRVEVSSDEWVVGDLEDQAAGLLREAIRSQNVGVPVTDGSDADMVLRVTITDTNFTAALAWEWQLIDQRNGAIVASKTETSIFGHMPDAIATLVMAELVGIDTSPYAGGGRVVAAAKAPAGPPSNPTSKTDGSKTWAVVIGIDNYRNALPRAAYAERDAMAFAELANKTLGVPETQIKLLLGQRATRTDVMGALSEWLPRNAVEPGGRVLVFFSGHGAPNAEDQGAYLMPWDADPAYLKTGGVSVSQVQQELEGLRGQQVFVFLDACFSGSGDRSVLAAGTRPLVPVKLSGSSNTVTTFSAAGAGETTGVASASQHGLFTSYLLAGLAGGADDNGDADVSVQELAKYVTDNVERDARRQNRDQQPTIVLPKRAEAGRTILVHDLSAAGE